MRFAFLPRLQLRNESVFQTWDSRPSQDTPWCSFTWTFPGTNSTFASRGLFIACMRKDSRSIIMSEKRTETRGEATTSSLAALEDRVHLRSMSSRCAQALNVLKGNNVSSSILCVYIGVKVHERSYLRAGLAFQGESDNNGNGAKRQRWFKVTCRRVFFFIFPAYW